MPKVERQLIRARMVVPIAVAILLIAGSTAFYVLYTRSSSVNSDNEEYAFLLNQQNTWTAQSKFNTGATAWQTYAVKTPSKSHRNAAYINAATLYLGAGENQDAVAMCQKAEQTLGVTYTEASAAAIAYMLLGNKAQAIHYYKEDIRLIPPNTTDKSAEVASYNQAVQELGGGS
jgi:tetratricopeptide (TPR) repeat protein